MSNILILMYHIVDEPKSQEEARFTCTPKLFKQHMQYLRKNNFNIIGMDQLLLLLREQNGIPDNAVVITLDDGFKNNYEHAFPIFQEFEIPAIIYLASGLMEKTNVWMHNKGFPKRQMLSWDNVREMHKNGIFFGAHTVNHVKLPELSAEEMYHEISQSKQMIEDQLGERVIHFAYPYGLLDDTAKEKVIQAGFSTACSTRSGFNKIDTDAFVLRRLEVYGSDSIRALKQKLTFGVNNSEPSFMFKYYTKRVLQKLGKN